MLKTSGSTKSTTKPGKGGVGVGGDGVGDGVDDSGNDDEHSPRGSRQVHKRTHQLVWPRLWSSMVRLMEVEVVLLKNHQKIEESSKVEKPQKPKKLQRSSVRRNVYRSTDPPSIWYKELLALLKPLRIGSPTNCKLGDTKGLSFRQVCKAHELSRYHFWIDYQPGSPCQSASLVLLLRVPLHQVIVCKTHIIPLLNLGNAPRKKTSQPKIKKEMLDSWEDVKRVVHHQGLFYVPEVIWTELTKRYHEKSTWHQENSRTRCQERALDLQLLPIPTHRRKGTSYDSILVIVGRLTKMIHYKPVQIMIDAPGLAKVLQTL